MEKIKIGKTKRRVGFSEKILEIQSWPGYSWIQATCQKMDRDQSQTRGSGSGSGRDSTSLIKNIFSIHLHNLGIHISLI